MAGQNVIKMFGFYVLQQDEIGVRLSLGKYSGIVGPGPGFAAPILQAIVKTTASLQTIDLPDQQIVLSGNIAVTISGNLNFRVVDPAKALLELSDYRYSIRQLALTTIADVLGTKTIEDVRERKGDIASEIEQIISLQATEWGLGSVDIRLTDAKMDESLLRAMMRETEARKEASALQIKADSDRQAAQMFSDAATALARSPGAMTLRVLQTLSDLSNSKSTVVIPIPMELLSGFGSGSSTGQTSARAMSGRPATTGTATSRTTVASPPPTSTPTSQTSSSPTSSSKATTDSEEASREVPPLARLEMSDDKVHAICPHCQVALNVANVHRDMRYDRMRDVPGQQLKCVKCSGIFTLPGTV